MVGTTEPVPLDVRQGASWECVLTFPDDTGLAWSSGKMQVRAYVSAPTVVVELSTDNGRMALSVPTPGQLAVTLTLDMAETATLPRLVGVWDMRVVSADGTIKYLVPVSTFLIRGAVTA